jgi:branched-chain amino acid transport system ATP-binding protein
MAPLLRIDNLAVSYGRIAALRGISLEVNEGEIVAVIGPNGAGKSTMLLSVMGAVPAKSGQVILDGRSILGMSPERIVRQGISLVPEGRRIFSRLTVAENLRMGATVRKGSNEIKTDIERELQRFPALRKYFAAPAGKLSGGEQQQLAISRALLSRPRVLLLDEPSLGLAPMIVQQVFDVLKELRRDGVTILLVEQFADRARAIADRSYVMRSGAVVLTISDNALVGRREFEAAYFGFGQGEA